MSKILCKPVVNVAFNEIMSFETQRMSSEMSGSWQSHSLAWNSGSMDTRTVALWRRVKVIQYETILFQFQTGPSCLGVVIHGIERYTGGWGGGPYPVLAGNQLIIAAVKL